MSRKSEYKISRELADKCLEALSDHWFDATGEYNNDEVIEADNELREVIRKQDEELLRKEKPIKAPPYKNGVLQNNITQLSDEGDYYERKRLEQNAIKEKVDKARKELAIATEDKSKTPKELMALKYKILKLEDQWLWAGYTGD